jgi:hypothetical protein
MSYTRLLPLLVVLYARVVTKVWFGFRRSPPLMMMTAAIVGRSGGVGCCLLFVVAA